MSFLCINYPRFQLNSTDLGIYVFEINPSTYDVFPSRTTRPYTTIQSSDPTVDQDYNKIDVVYRWDYMSESMWNDIYPYYAKNVDGTSLIGLTFSDATIGRFSNTPITVCKFTGTTQAGYFPVDRFSVEMIIRQIS